MVGRQVKLTPEAWKVLDDFAREAGVSTSEVVRRAVAIYALQNLELRIRAAPRQPIAPGTPIVGATGVDGEAR